MSAARFQSGLRPPFISSLLRFLPLCLSFSPFLFLFFSFAFLSSFAELPAFLFYTTRTNTTLTLALVRLLLASLLSPLLLSLSLSPTSCSFFSTHPSPPLVFFSPHHYNGAALFGPGHKQPRIGTTPWCRLAVILYNTCNGCCDGSPGHPLRERDILYEGETIARTRRSTTGFK